MNKRRKIVIALGASLFAAPLFSFAQQQGKVWRIGFLEPGNPAVRTHLIDAFRNALGELGYSEGRNIVIELRFAEGHPERLPELAAELVRLKVDVIVVSGTPSIRAARRATQTIPIIMTAVGDPVAEGFVASFAKPGGNITGRTIQAPELSAKRLQLLKETVPRVSRVGILWDPTIVHEVHGFKEAEAAASSLGITLLSVPLKRAEDLEPGFTGMVRDKANGVFVFPSGTTSNNGKLIASLAIKHRLPAICGASELAEAGCLLSYGPFYADNYRRAAAFVDKVLKGTKPADIPVEQPTKFELIINSKTAKALGIKIPNSILVRADRVIE